MRLPITISEQGRRHNPKNALSDRCAASKHVSVSFFNVKPMDRTLVTHTRVCMLTLVIAACRAHTSLQTIDLTLPGVTVDTVDGVVTRRRVVDFESALDSAVHIAREMLPSARPRVAPLVVRSFSATGDSASTLMYARCVFVLMNMSNVHARTGAVYVPVALARRAFEHRQGEPLLANSPSRHDVQQLFDSIPYDVEITVNADHAFRFVYPECTSVPGYSATSVLLHELMHGLGMVSLVGVDPTGDLRAYRACVESRRVPCVCAHRACACSSERTHRSHGRAPTDVSGRMRLVHVFPVECWNRDVHVVDTGSTPLDRRDTGVQPAALSTW